MNVPRDEQLTPEQQAELRENQIIVAGFGERIRKQSMGFDIALIGTMSVSSIARLIPAHNGFRDLLPEPWDIQDHIGNMAVTYGIVSTLVGRAHEDIENYSDHEYRRRRLRTALFAGTLTVGLNAFAEMIGYGPISTPDIVDVGYGLLGGYLGYKAGSRHEYYDEDTISELSKSAETNPKHRATLNMIAADIRDKHKHSDEPESNSILDLLARRQRNKNSPQRESIRGNARTRKDKANPQKVRRKKRRDQKKARRKNR